MRRAKTRERARVLLSTKEQFCHQLVIEKSKNKGKSQSSESLSFTDCNDKKQRSKGATIEAIYLVDFYDTHVNDIWLFQNKYWLLRSFDLYSVLTRQKSGFENLLECFLPSTFARIISVLPEKFQKFL